MAQIKSTTSGSEVASICKVEYLKNPVVVEFLEHLRGLLTKDPFRHEIPPRESNKSLSTWKCKNLADALGQYCWNDQSFDKNNQVLLGLSESLKDAVSINNETKTLRACMNILNWGHVPNGAYGITKLFLDGVLAQSIKCSSQLLSSETVDLSYFGNKKRDESNEGDIVLEDASTDDKMAPQRLIYRMNASFTKIYSLYSETPFIIYDSRVAAAFGLIARLYWEGKCPGLDINDLLRFSFPEGRSKGARDASLRQIKFKQVKSDRDHALWNVRANWIIEESLRNIDMFAGRTETRDKVRAVEAALFMIGKRVTQ
jgi:hypothetical protein